jgi:sulfur carrier protein
MRVLVNGSERECAPGTTVAQLLSALGFAGAAVAVERNQRLVPRAEHARTVLVEGDRLELVTLVGGG